MTNPARHADPLIVVYKDGWGDYFQLLDDNDEPVKLVALGATARLVVIDQDGAVVQDLTSGSGLTLANDGTITISSSWNSLFETADLALSITMSGIKETYVADTSIRMIRAAGDDF